MSKETHLELKVGLFICAAIVGLILFIFSITDTPVFEDGRSLQVIFSFANGVNKNAPVRVAGVETGRVKQINLFFDHRDNKTKAKIELWLKKELRVPIDSTITINQLGLLGEKYIEIRPGKNTKEFYQEGELVNGRDPISQDIITQRILDVANRLDETITGFNVILYDEGNLDSLNSTLKSMSSLSANLDDMILSLKEGRGTVGKLLYDERLYDDLEGLAADLKENPWKLLYKPKRKKTVKMDVKQ